MNFIRSIILFFLAGSVISIQGCGDRIDNKNGKDTENLKNELEGSVSISGAFALYPLVITWRDEFQKLHPKVKINVVAGGAGKGIAEALAHHVNLGMVSRDINSEEISKGAWALTVAKDAVVPTMNASNPYIKELLTKGLTKEQFRDLWVNRKITNWGELTGNTAVKDIINVFTRSDASGAAETWANYLGGVQKDLKGVGVLGDPTIADAVKKDKFAIGYNNIAYVYDLKTQKPYEGLVVVPIDINGNGTIDSTENFYEDYHKIITAIAHNVYPAPPARELYFVSDGPPQDPIIRAFFRWILTDGQEFVPEAGYIRLSKNRINSELEILDTEWINN